MQLLLEQHAPLIDTQKGTTYSQAIFTTSDTGPFLQHILLKTYNARTGLTFDYKFNPDGSLVALHGNLVRWNGWYAEADLFPNADGTIPRFQVNYRKTLHGGVIAEPEDGAIYSQIFTQVPVYRAIKDTPCGVQLLEAEKSNAT